MTPCQHLVTLIRLARDGADNVLGLPAGHFRAQCSRCGELFIVKPLELEVKYPEEKKA